ncbi:MAG: flagellar protein FliT [Dehalococcoidia bacterium]|nr:flagellar protein FliT [Dehalococcoidia bacterium]
MARSLAAIQFELLREVFDLARAQRASLERDDIDAVLDLMGEREAIIDRLARLAEQAAETPENLVVLPGAEEHARQDALALDTVIRGILEHDRQNEEMLYDKVQQLREELPRLQQGRRLAGAYRASSSVPGSFVSRSS